MTVVRPDGRTRARSGVRQQTRLATVDGRDIQRGARGVIGFAQVGHRLAAKRLCGENRYRNADITAERQRFRDGCLPGLRLNLQQSLLCQFLHRHQQLTVTGPVEQPGFAATAIAL